MMCLVSRELGSTIKGINILGSPGCQARAVYDGVVSRGVQFRWNHVVMVRHGSYISVYCNLRSVSVSTGQRVSTRQALGTVGADNILQFQLHHETTTLNPSRYWLAVKITLWRHQYKDVC